MTRLGREVVKARPRQKGQLALNDPFHFLSGQRVKPIPFVDAHHQSTTRLRDKARNVRILIGDVLLGIEQQDRHMGILNGLKGLDHGELLHRLEDAALSPKPCRVDQAIPNTLPLKRNLDGIAGGAGHVKGNDPLLPQEGIHQGGLAHIRAAHNRHAQTVGWHAEALVDVILGRRLGGLDRQCRQATKGSLDEAVNPIAVGARHWQRLPEAQLIKLTRAPLTSKALELVDGQHGGPACSAQLFGNLQVLWRDPSTTIHHEDHHIRLRHSLQTLPSHLGINARLGHRLEAARVNDKVGPWPKPTLAIVAVSGEPRHVRHQRISRAREAIEQGGLAHVRAAHQGHHRLGGHGGAGGHLRGEGG